MKKIVSIFISIIFLASSLLLPAAAEQAPTPAIDSSPMHSSENSRYSKTELRRLETLQQTKEMADGLEDSSESSANSISSSPDEPLFSEERVIVKLSSGARLRRATPNLGVEYNDMHLLNPSASTFSTAAVSTRSMTMTDEKNNVFVLTLKEPGKDAVEKALKTLRENPAVELAEPDYFRTAWSDPDTDPYEVFAADIIGAPKAWEITEGSKEIVVGIIDSGIDGTHPDLKDNLWVNPNPNQNGYIDDLHGYSFTDKQGGVPDDELGHGTHVAGIVGALGMNEYSFKGVSPKVSLAALNVSIGGSAMISDSACIEALNYADNHGIKITNNSYGGYGYSEIFEEAIENYDGLFVAAAGNESLDNDEMFAYPASYDCPNIISVASTDKNDNLSLFSNYGDETVDIAAPGEGILSTVPPNAVMNEDSGSEYAVWDGTSMASPHVAGVAALVLSENPGFTTEELRNAVLDGADRLPGLQDLTDKGRRLDAYHALSPRSPIESFSLDYKTDSLDIYDMAKINAIITPTDAFQSVLWESSDPETVRISGDGYIIGLKKGTATVTARSFASPEFSANVQITVSGTVADAVPFLDFAFKQAVIDNLKEVDPETYADYALESRITREDAEKVIEIGISSLGIEDLTGLSSLVNLERLICPGNMLPELDVSKNTALIELDCSWCNIYELDLRNNPNLKILNCSGNGLSELNFSWH